MDYQLVRLSQEPHFAETCAAWVYGEWRCQRKEASYPKVLAYLQSAGQPESDLFECWVAVQDWRPLGMACLKRVEHVDRLDLSPWLGSVYVHPEFRGGGLAHALIAQVERQAVEEYGAKECYLQTGIPAFYVDAGWEDIGRVRDTRGLNKDGWVLMRKSL
ncbi:MAG: GNAT family N-acetyltransferase [Rhodospirillales bacterium]|mgnify:CR=1 FL=1|nr:GNAT family N-acetyltransferase [Rhodospirillales bacterium]